MKKILLFSLLAVFSSTAALADATIQLNNYDPDRPILLNIIYPDTHIIAADKICGPIRAELLADGKTIASLNIKDGYFDKGVGVIPGAADNATVTFTLLALGGPKGYEAFYSGSVTWTQATGSWDPTTVPPVPMTGPSLNMPQSLVLYGFPEPSTTALGILGAAALFFCRRNLNH